jgi:hypothetical protein
MVAWLLFQPSWSAVQFAAPVSAEQALALVSVEGLALWLAPVLKRATAWDLSACYRLNSIAVVAVYWTFCRQPKSARHTASMIQTSD